MIDMSAIAYVGNTFVLYVLYGFFLRAILAKFLPNDLFNGFDGFARYIRTLIATIVETLWGNKENGEVLFLSRILVPFAALFTLESGITLLLGDANDFLAMKIILFLLRLFIFINVAPTLEDWDHFFQTPAKSRIIIIVKFLILIPIISNSSTWSFYSQEIDYLLLTLFCFPVTGGVFDQETIKLEE